MQVVGIVSDGQQDCVIAAPFCVCVDAQDKQIRDPLKEKTAPYWRSETPQGTFKEDKDETQGCLNMHIITINIALLVSESQPV